MMWSDLGTVTFERGIRSGGGEMWGGVDDELRGTKPRIPETDGNKARGRLL